MSYGELFQPVKERVYKSVTTPQLKRPHTIPAFIQQT